MLVAALVVLNIYPVRLVRTQMLEQGRQEMETSGQTLAAALSGYAELTNENIRETIEMLDSASNKRVLVLNARGVVMTDSQQTSNLIGKMTILNEVMSALEGYDTVRVEYDDSALRYIAALPTVKEGEIVGAVYLYREDVENAAFLRDVRTDIYNITAVGLLLFTCGVVFFNIALGRRFDTLLTGIAAVDGGDYDYQIEMRGNDELSDISNRFNDMSRRLKKTEAARHQFVSDASHELKTPLASIKLLSDSVIQNENVSEENLREFVQDIGDEIQRLIDISESLLSLSRLDDSPDSKRVCCDLRRNVLKCIEILRGSCEHYQVTIHPDIRGDYYVWGSSDGIFHIVFNLLENAVKYNKPGGNVWVKLSRLGDQTVLLVRDDGIGIPEEDIPRIYDRFYRVDKARSRQTGGTGLGLSIVNEWVSDMGGHIEVKSQPDKGTTFKVTLASCEKGDVDAQ